MKISSSSIQLSSHHSLIEKQEVEESIRMWVGDRRPDFEGRETSNSSGRSIPEDVVALSSKSRTSELIKELIPDDEDDYAPTPELRVLKMIIERIFGKKIRLSSSKAVQDAAKDLKDTKPERSNEAQPEQQQGFGIEYDRSESYYESEKTAFSAKGVINTTDGKTISFNLNLKLSREFMSEQNINFRAGDAKLKDPLVINFDGASTQLTSTKFDFDIDSDGKEDRISFVGPNSGFLAIDRNNDNKINDGGELFGPETGKGFAELAKYDSDNNNWIDENDPIYNKLLIWSKDGQGNDELVSLRQKGVGAIYLGYQTTLFELNNRRNEMQGLIRSSGIYVREGGTVGTIQQVDLSA